MDICVTLAPAARKQTGAMSLSAFLISRARKLKHFTPDEARAAAKPKGGKLYHVYLDRGARALVSKYGAAWGLERPGEIVRAMLHLFLGEQLRNHQERNRETAPGPRSRDLV